MRQPPPFRQIARFPITGGVGLLSLVVTLAYWSHWDIRPLATQAPNPLTAPWRLIGAALPHVDAFHLGFNLYWLWAFGTLVEMTFGPLAMAGLVVLLAAGASAAEFAVFDGGVGLSGVVYGLFAMVWVLSRRDARFTGAVDRSTVTVFVIWFFLCIVMTLRHIWPVANVAHGAGAALGALAGWSIVSRGSRRALAAGTTIFALVAILWGATAGRPTVNFSPYGGEPWGRMGLKELRAGHHAQSVPLFRRALAYRYQMPEYWCDLGVAHYELGQWDQALTAFDKAVAHRDDAPDYWYNLGLARSRLGRWNDAVAAFTKAAALAPDQEKYRKVLEETRAYQASLQAAQKN